MNFPHAGNQDVKHMQKRDDGVKKVDRGIFDLLISNMDKEVRDMAQNILIYALTRLFELN